MSIQIYEWEEMKKLSLEKKNSLLGDLERQGKLTEKEIEFLEDLQVDLENEFWMCQSCNNFSRGRNKSQL